MKLYIYYETINTHNSDGTEHYRVALACSVQLFPRSVKSSVIVRVRSGIVFLPMESDLKKIFFFSINQCVISYLHVDSRKNILYIFENSILYINES